METFSALLALCEGNSPVTGEFPTQRPVTRSFDVFFDLRLNKRLSKPSGRRWFETPSRSSYVTVMDGGFKYRPGIWHPNFVITMPADTLAHNDTRILSDKVLTIKLDIIRFSVFQWLYHNCDVTMGAMAAQITGLTIVYSGVHSGADQRKHQSSASLAFVRGITGDRWIPRTNGQ